MDHGMWLGMALIAIGVPLACFGALPKERGQHGDHAGTNYEAPDSTPLGRWHAATLLVLTLGLLLWDRFAVVARSTTMQIRNLDRSGEVAGQDDAPPLAAVPSAARP